MCSNRPDVFYKEDVFKRFARLTKKHLALVCFNKVASIHAQNFVQKTFFFQHVCFIDSFNESEYFSNLLAVVFPRIKSCFEKVGRTLLFKRALFTIKVP